MPGNLEAIQTLQDNIDAEGFRGIDKQYLLDSLQSLNKVGGSLSITNGGSPDEDITLASGWNRIDVWQSSRDTQGVRDGLNDGVDPGGYYVINDVSAGDYTVGAHVRFVADIEGEYRLRVAQGTPDGQNSSQTQNEDRLVNVPVGVSVSMSIVQGLVKGVSGDERLQLEIRGPNGATVTIGEAQFGVTR